MLAHTRAHGRKPAACLHVPTCPAPMNPTLPSTCLRMLAHNRADVSYHQHTCACTQVVEELGGGVSQRAVLRRLRKLGLVRGGKAGGGRVRGGSRRSKVDASQLRELYEQFKGQVGREPARAKSQDHTDAYAHAGMHARRRTHAYRCTCPSHVHTHAHDVQDGARARWAGSPREQEHSMHTHACMQACMFPG